MSPQIAVVLARLRMPAILALTCLLVADWVWHVLPGGPAALPRNGRHLLADQAASPEPDLLPPPLTAR